MVKFALNEIANWEAQKLMMSVSSDLKLIDANIDFIEFFLYLEGLKK